MPTITPGDAVIKAAEDLKEALQNNMPKNSETEEGIRQLMKIFQQQHEVQKLPKSNERAEKCREAAQEADLQFSAQAQRVASNNVEFEETEASQRVATEDSNAKAEKTARLLSQDDDSDEETAEPIICHPEEENSEKLDGPA